MINLQGENNELKMYIQKLKNENLENIKNNFKQTEISRIYDPSNSYQPSVMYEAPKYQPPPQQQFFSPFPTMQYSQTPKYQSPKQLFQQDNSREETPP